MRLIDADALAKVKFHGYPEIEITPSDVNAEAYKRGWNDAIDAIIESVPSIDAVQVIRCKDCKYARMTYDGDCKYCDVWFPDEAEYLDGDYYCASAERKEE